MFLMNDLDSSKIRDTTPLCYLLFLYMADIKPGRDLNKLKNGDWYILNLINWELDEERWTNSLSGPHIDENISIRQRTTYQSAKEKSFAESFRSLLSRIVFLKINNSGLVLANKF